MTAGRSSSAAWALVKTSVDWKQLKPISQQQQTKVAERFLAMPIAPRDKQTFGSMPFVGIRRAHVKAILGRFDHPHAAEAVLRLQEGVKHGERNPKALRRH